MYRTIVLTLALAVSAAFAAETPASEASIRMSNQEAPVCPAVQAFYDAFDAEGFDRAPDFTTEDWNHITPLGSRTRGRAQTVARIKQVHSTFLKGVSETIDQMDVRFATPEVAVATVTSHAGAFTTPDGVRHEDPQQIRTFMVVKRETRWLIVQDHATFVTAQPAERR